RSQSAGRGRGGIRVCTQRRLPGGRGRVDSGVRMSAQQSSPRRLTIAKAISEALSQAMHDDPSVLVMGEDIAQLGGVFGTTQGLLAAYGPERVRDTPISETGFIGTAVG